MLNRLLSNRLYLLDNLGLDNLRLDNLRLDSLGLNDLRLLNHHWLLNWHRLFQLC